MDVMTLAAAKAYTDKQRLAYGEKTTKETVFVPEMSVTELCETSLPIPFVPGETYTVKYDGVEYECEAKKGKGAVGSEVWVYVGTVQMFDYPEYVGEFPFMVGWCLQDCHNGEYTYVIVPVDGKTHTISVYQHTVTETIHAIDQKYIPAMDSLTLNGAGGKQYKVTVENGALAVTEVG